MKAIQVLILEQDITSTYLLSFSVGSKRFHTGGGSGESGKKILPASYESESS